MNAERFRKLQEVLRRRQPDLTVLMERVHKSHNLSAILRNCDAAGVLQAHAIPPKDGLEIHAHTSAGTSKWVKVVRHRTLQAATEFLRAEGFRIVAAHPGDGAADYREVDFTAPTAIMVGAELLGLTDEALGLADQLVEIPMLGMASSLNVSVATALLLFEAARQRTAARMYQTSRLPPEEFERILFEWAYPRVSRRLREDGRSYPTLSPTGEFHL
ncbi:MAG: tRNA (guanosine(18)-2'-O)-methyltransferase TrmH [Gemmatimonadetes bacterium]|nr:tRNA (guanosine(18)-2'-O)-methyltransferase TrmH [Gemmatimonadota bacterium]